MNLKLKAKIIERFGTQADFANIVNEDDSLVSKVVRGRRILSDEKQKIWAKVLDSSIDEIFRQRH